MFILNQVAYTTKQVVVLGKLDLLYSTKFAKAYTLNLSSSSEVLGKPSDSQSGKPFSGVPPQSIYSRCIDGDALKQYGAIYIV